VSGKGRGGPVAALATGQRLEALQYSRAESQRSPFARKSSRHAAKLLVELIDHQWLITDGHTFEVRHVQS
jgi:hypothetical protein